MNLFTASYEFSWNPKLPRWVAPTAFGVTSVAFLVLAIALQVSRDRFFARAHHAAGTVVALTLQAGGGALCPVVEYVPEGGVATRFTGRTCFNPRTHERGQQVVVAYLPDGSSHEQIVGERSLGFIPYLLSLAFFLASLFSWWLARKTGPRAAAQGARLS